MKFWQVPAYLDYVQPALTDAAVAAAEQQLGVKLPTSYLELLRLQNGGYLRGTWPETVSRTLYGIGPQFPSITRDGGWWRPKNAAPEDWAPPGAELLIPFDGDGHWDMCFDYRLRGPAGEPTIAFVDCECEEERAITDSFAGYLSGLVDETAENDTRIYGDVTPESVARRLSERLSVADPTMSDFDHGYPIWHLALPGEYQSCWVTPNRVPAGFRREKQLVITTPDTAIRLPEDPACVVLLSCTDESKAAVSAALAALKLAP